MNLYGYAGNNPEKASDPFGLLWTITREGSAQAEAVACNDTIDELAKIIGLAAEEYQKWLEPAYYSGPRFLPSSSSETIPYQKFYIPNIIYAYWGGNLMGFGRWAINWNASISYLRKLGFQVLEIRHERGDQLRMNRDITYLLQQKTIHGVYYAGHGSERGLFTGNKWRTLRKVKGKRIGIPVGFVDFGDPGDEVLNYWEIRGSTDDYYHLAFGLIFACFSDHGGYPLVGYYPRPGAIWQGDDNIFWVTLEPGMNGPYYDPDADVPEPFHVEHWIRPGDQGTQPNGGWQ